MTISVTHTTPADDSFSAEGAAAWDAGHAVAGLGTMAEQNANNVAITGGTISGVSITGSISTATNLAGGSSGQIAYQSAPGITTFVTAGSSGQVLSANAGGIPTWIVNTVGTVTSVGGTGTVNGLTLTGSVTTSGDLTLGGTLDLSTPPVIGGTTPNTITGTTITANTKFVSSYFDASGSGGGSLRNASGTALIQWGGGGGTNITISGATNINPANQQVDISPTGTGRVNIHPVGALDISPVALGTMDNVAIGATTASTGKFTSLVATAGIGGGTF